MRNCNCSQTHHFCITSFPYTIRWWVVIRDLKTTTQLLLVVLSNKLSASCGMFTFISFVHWIKSEIQKFLLLLSVLWRKINNVPPQKISTLILFSNIFDENWGVFQLNKYWKAPWLWFLRTLYYKVHSAHCQDSTAFAAALEALEQKYHNDLHYLWLPTLSFQTPKALHISK